MSESGRTGMEPGGLYRLAALAALPPLLLGLAGALAVLSRWTVGSIVIWALWASATVGGRPRTMSARWRRQPASPRTGSTPATSTSWATLTWIVPG